MELEGKTCMVLSKCNHLHYGLCVCEQVFVWRYDIIIIITIIIIIAIDVIIIVIVIIVIVIVMVASLSPT